MRNSNIVKVDSKGRVLIPIHIRKFLRADDGTEIIIIQDNEKSQARMLPLVKGRTAELRFFMTDEPGSLAYIAKTLARHNLNIIMSKSRTLIKGKTAEWDVILDTSECDGNLEQIRKDIMNSNIVKNMEILRG